MYKSTRGSIIIKQSTGACRDFCTKSEKLSKKVLTKERQCVIIHDAIERTQGLLVLMPVWRNRQTPGT